MDAGVEEASRDHENWSKIIGRSSEWHLNGLAALEIGWNSEMHTESSQANINLELID